MSNRFKIFYLFKFSNFKNIDKVADNPELYVLLDFYTIPKDNLKIPPNTCTELVMLALGGTEEKFSPRHQSHKVYSGKYTKKLLILACKNYDMFEIYFQKIWTKVQKIITFLLLLLLITFFNAKTLSLPKIMIKFESKKT